MPTNQRELGAPENVLNQVAAAEPRQPPVAFRWRYGAECDDTRWHFSEIPIGSYLDRTIEPLYLAPPRDVLMAAMREVQEQSAVFAKQYVVSEPFIRHCINLGEIADRYASQVRPEQVNQQLLRTLHHIEGAAKDIRVERHHIASAARAAIAAAEAAQSGHIGDTDKMVHAVPDVLEQLQLAETEVINAKAWSVGEEAKKHCKYALTAIAVARAMLSASQKPEGGV